MRISKFKITAIIAIVLCFALTVPLLSGCSGAADNVPKIGENGNWWVGGVDTGVQAAGPDGDAGEAGAGIIPRIGENGNWWVGDVDTGIKAADDARVTPEMFGAVGDGVADDTEAMLKALKTGKPVYLTKTYRVTELDCTDIKKIVMLGKKDLTATLGTSQPENDGYNIIFEGAELFKNAPTRYSLENIRIYAKNEGILTTESFSGSWVSQCNFTNFGGVFMGSMKGLTKVVDCTFSQLGGPLTTSGVDSIIVNNHISGKLSKHTTVCTGASFAGMVFEGNTVEYCKTVFGKYELWSFNRINGNLFDSIYRVFDTKTMLKGTEITGNTFVRIDYALAKDGWGDQADSEMKSSEWTAFTISKVCDRVNISGNSGEATVALKMHYNVANPCATYIDMSGVKGRIDFGYVNMTNPEGSTIFVKDLDYITVEGDKLPDAKLYDSKGNYMTSFNGQHVFFKGNLYMNNNGEWLQITNNPQQ